MHRRTLAAALLATTLMGGGCCHQHSVASPHAPCAQILTRTELFFGLSRPDGGTVTAEQWEAFLNTTVTPLFPAGLTVIDARGQWQEASGEIAREPSRILIILHEPAPDADAKIEHIRDAFKKQFAQEAVLRTDSRQRVSF